MKKLSSLLVCLLLSCYSFCQEAGAPKHVVLSEVAVSAKKSETGRHKQKVRSFNAHYIINPNHGKKNKNELYLGAYFAPLNKALIKIYTIELKLAPYDTTLFTTKLIIAQVQSGGDTMFRTFEINGADIKNKKLLLDVKKENLVLEPGNYYVAYSFIAKNLDKTYSYRIYQNDKGEGASISLEGNHIKISRADMFNYNFPFKISYITL